MYNNNVCFLCMSTKRFILSQFFQITLHNQKSSLQKKMGGNTTSSVSITPSRPTIGGNIKNADMCFQTLLALSTPQMRQTFAANNSRQKFTGDNCVCETVHQAATTNLSLVSPETVDCTTVPPPSETPIPEVPEVPTWMTCYRRHVAAPPCAETDFRVALTQRASILSAITVFTSAALQEMEDTTDSDGGITHAVMGKLRSYLSSQQIHLMACDSCDFVTFQTFATFFSLHGQGNILAGHSLLHIDDCPEFLPLPLHWQRRHWVAAEMWLARLRYSALPFTMKVKMLWLNTGLSSPSRRRAKLLDETITLHWTDIPLYMVERRRVVISQGFCTVALATHMDEIMEHLTRRLYSTLAENWLLRMHVNATQYVTSQIYRCCQAGLLTGSRAVFDLLDMCPNLVMRTDAVRTVAIRDGQNPFMTQSDAKPCTTGNLRAVHAIARITCDSPIASTDTDKVCQLLQLLHNTAPPCITQLLVHVQQGKNALKHYGRRQLVLFLKSMQTPLQLVLSLMQYACRLCPRAIFASNATEVSRWMSVSTESELSCQTLLHNRMQQSFCPFVNLCVSGCISANNDDDEKHGAITDGGNQTMNLLQLLEDVGFDVPQTTRSKEVLANFNSGVQPTGVSDCRALCARVAKLRSGRSSAVVSHPSHFMANNCKRVPTADSSTDDDDE